MNARRLLVTATAVLVVASVVAQQKQAYSPHPSHMVRNRGLVSTVDSTRLREEVAGRIDGHLVARLEALAADGVEGFESILILP